MSQRLFRRLSVLLVCAVIGAGAATVAPAGAANDSVDLDQCANEHATAPVACDWQNGNLNGNNSDYAEGDVVPFRLALENLGAGSHTIHINYDFTAGGREAYDFLATYNATENVDLCTNGGGAISGLCGNPRSQGSLPAPQTVAFPSDPFVPDLTNGLSVSGAQSASAVNQALTIFGAETSPGPSISAITTHSGPATGQSSADLTVTFTTVGNNRDVLMAWGGHLAASSYWITDDGAGNVSGAPWHMRTLNLDNGGAANQDRSIQSSAISPRGSITVVKETLPDGNTQSFSFDPSWSDTNFNLSDGQSADSGDLVPGTYSVTEALTPGWTQTSAICSDQSPVTAINLAADETVVCTLTNTLDPEPEMGSITVVKETAPDTSDESFTFDPSWSDDNFTLTDGDSHSSGDLAAGRYSVAELPTAGWTLSGATCDDDDSTVDAINLAAGEDVTCTFVNTSLPGPDPEFGTITVFKHTVPGNSTESFTFDPSWSTDNFSLTHGQSASNGDLEPGAYSVSELATPGWTQTSAVCEGESSPDAIDLAADETVVCVFTNTLDPEPAKGSITVVKETAPDGSSESFTFDPSWSTDNFSLKDGLSASKADLAPGTYSVAEVNLPTGWSLSGASCTDGSPVSAISVSAGDQVTCTFLNTLAVDPVVESSNETQTNPNTGTPTQPAQTVPVSNPAVPATPANSAAGAETSPTAATELPRTGAGLREETLLGLALLAAGLLGRTLGRRRPRPSSI